MKAGLVAMELRKLADALDAQPDAEIISPWISFYGSDKDQFLATARLLPRPLKKHVNDEGKTYSRVKVTCEGFQAIDVNASIPQSLTCELVVPAKPAVYRCEPILSEEEDAGMGRMIGEYDFGIDDRIPQPYVEPENPFETYAKEVEAWHNKEEAAWRIAGRPPFFDYNDEPYPVRPEDVR